MRCSCSTEEGKKKLGSNNCSKLEDKKCGKQSESVCIMHRSHLPPHSEPLTEPLVLCPKDSVQLM